MIMCSGKVKTPGRKCENTTKVPSSARRCDHGPTSKSMLTPICVAIALYRSCFIFSNIRPQAKEHWAPWGSHLHLWRSHIFIYEGSTCKHNPSFTQAKQRTPPLNYTFHTTTTPKETPPQLHTGIPSRTHLSSIINKWNEKEMSWADLHQDKSHWVPSSPPPPPLPLGNSWIQAGNKRKHKHQWDLPFVGPWNTGNV